MRHFFMMFVVFCVAFNCAAVANIASSGYVREYYRDMCRNSSLDLQAASGIASKSYTLSVVDRINQGQTTYAADLAADAIVASTYLPKTLTMLAAGALCCPDNYYDQDYDECRSCGTWSGKATVQCLDEGEYRNGSSCSSCPSGYTCPAGTNGKITNALIAVQCLDDDEYRTKNTCQPCTDGYLCPAGQNDRENCGAGYWCVGGVATVCEYGPNQCPGENHTSQPTTVACDDAITAISAISVQCLDEGEYRNGSSCSSCPSGYTCPAGTNGKLTSSVNTVQCLNEGEYRSKNTCVVCTDGYMCPAGQNNRENCGAGYWCVGGVVTACEYGPNQCPGENHTSQPTTIACDNGYTFTN